MGFQVREREGRALVSYACLCGCKPTAMVSVAQGAPGSEHCCCGRVHFAGPDAAGALQRYLTERRARGEDKDIIYHFFETIVQTSWTAALPVAYAVPESELHREGASPPDHSDIGGAA